MICKKCNKEIPDDAILCCYCGYKIRRDKKKTRTANGTGYVFKRGSTWTVRVTTGWKELEGGKKTPIQSYKGGFKTRKEAQDYVSVLKNPQKQEKSFPTFEKLFEEWFEFYTSSRSLAKSTRDNYKTAYSHTESIRKMSIDKITKNDLQKILNDPTFSHRTKVNIQVTLSMVFEYGMDEYGLEKSPVNKLYLGENDSKPRPPITEDDLKIIESHFDDEPYAKYVYAMSYLGFRPSAFFGLKKSDYHDEDGVQYLVGGIKTEAGKNRSVTIPPKILPIIKERLEVEGTDILFPRYAYNRANKFIGYITMASNYFCAHVFKPMFKRIGINGDKTPYSTRHTYTNKLKNADGPDRDKADLVGHTNYDFTKKTYQSSDLKDRKRITDQMV